MVNDDVVDRYVACSVGAAVGVTCALASCTKNPKHQIKHNREKNDITNLLAHGHFSRSNIFPISKRIVKYR
jgi:hypothetical protein